jgi:long-chain acyl-CoA synthetase
VLEVAVIGVPDDKTGEAVRAYIVPQRDGLTEEAVRAHCKRRLADYKLPRSVVLRKELPKTPIGKILRKELRAEAHPTTAPRQATQA